MISGTNH